MDKKILRHIAFAGFVLALMPPLPVESKDPELQKGMTELRAKCRRKCKKAIIDGQNTGKCATQNCMTTWTEFYKECKGCEACPPDYP